MIVRLAGNDDCTKGFQPHPQCDREVAVDAYFQPHSSTVGCDNVKLRNAGMCKAITQVVNGIGAGETCRLRTCTVQDETFCGGAHEGGG